MKTIEVTPEAMKQRSVRYADLQPYQKSIEAQTGIPVKVMEKLAANKVFPIMGPASHKGRSAGAPIKGADGLMLNLAECPPGDGPGLHCHEQTIESFFCINGRFEVAWGDKGENKLVLDPCDFVSVPPGVCRKFTNISDKTAHLLSIIQLPGHDQQDPSAFAPEVGKEVADEFGEPVLEKLKSIGIRFDAGIDTSKVEPNLDLEAIRKKYSEREIKIGSHTWRYMESGDHGPAVVLLPGAQGTSEVYASQLEALGPDHRVLSVFYPAISDADELADSFIAFLDAVGLKQINLVGGSFGGYWAQVFAAKYPERVTTLFVVTSFVDATVIQQRGKPAADIRATPAAEIRAQRIAFVNKMPDGVVKNTLLALSEKQGDENLKSRVLGVATAKPVVRPALKPDRVVVIECDNDSVLPPPVRQQVREFYAESPHYKLEAGDHFPALLNPSAINDIIRRHVK